MRDPFEFYTIEGGLLAGTARIVAAKLHNAARRLVGVGATAGDAAGFFTFFAPRGSPEFQRLPACCCCCCVTQHPALKRRLGRQRNVVPPITRYGIPQALFCVPSSHGVGRTALSPFGTMSTWYHTVVAVASKPAELLYTLRRSCFKHTAAYIDVVGSRLSFQVKGRRVVDMSNGENTLRQHQGSFLRLF